MIEKILEYGGVIFAAVGIICLFLEAFAVIKRKTNPKLVIAGIVCLTVSVVGFLVTEVILHDKDTSPIFTLVWVLLLWAYIICNLVSALLISRKNRLANNQPQDEQDEKSGDEFDDKQD